MEERSRELLRQCSIPVAIDQPILKLLAKVFREIREGKTSEGVSLKKPSTVLSTAEAIGVAMESALQAHFFGSGKVSAQHVAGNILGSVVKEDLSDREAFQEYVVLVAKKRAAQEKLWKEFYESALDALK